MCEKKKLNDKVIMLMDYFLSQIVWSTAELSCIWSTAAKLSCILPYNFNFTNYIIYLKNSYCYWWYIWLCFWCYCLCLDQKLFSLPVVEGRKIGHYMCVFSFILSTTDNKWIWFGNIWYFFFYLFKGFFWYFQGSI